MIAICFVKMAHLHKFIFLLKAANLPGELYICVSICIRNPTASQRKKDLGDRHFYKDQLVSFVFVYVFQFIISPFLSALGA